GSSPAPPASIQSSRSVLETTPTTRLCSSTTGQPEISLSANSRANCRSVSLGEAAIGSGVITSLTRNSCSPRAIMVFTFYSAGCCRVLVRTCIHEQQPLRDAAVWRPTAPALAHFWLLQL